jgi:hypothetical protein
MARLRTALLCSALIALAACARQPGSFPAAEQPLDWAAVAEVGTPRIVTTDPDGELRETKLWFVVLDGRGYFRTGNSRWFRNLQRDPNLVLRIQDKAYPLRAELVVDDALRAKLNETFREKYGVSDFLVHPFGAPDANFLRLHPRTIR